MGHLQTDHSRHPLPVHCSDRSVSYHTGKIIWPACKPCPARRCPAVGWHRRWRYQADGSLWSKAGALPQHDSTDGWSYPAAAVSCRLYGYPKAAREGGAKGIPSRTFSIHRLHCGLFFVMKEVHSMKKTILTGVCAAVPVLTAAALILRRVRYRRFSCR